MYNIERERLMAFKSLLSSTSQTHSIDPISVANVFDQTPLQKGDVVEIYIMGKGNEKVKLSDKYQECDFYNEIPCDDGVGLALLGHKSGETLTVKQTINGLNETFYVIVGTKMNHLEKLKSTQTR